MRADELDKIGVLTERIDHLMDRLDRFEERVVTQHEFWPVKTLVYGGVTAALVALFGAIIALVIKP